MYSLPAARPSLAYPFLFDIRCVIYLGPIITHLSFLLPLLPPLRPCHCRLPPLWKFFLRLFTSTAVFCLLTTTTAILRVSKILSDESREISFIPFVPIQLCKRKRYCRCAHPLLCRHAHMLRRGAPLMRLPWETRLLLDIRLLRPRDASEYLRVYYIAATVASLMTRSYRRTPRSGTLLREKQGKVS